MTAKKNGKTKIIYREPADYFPEELRKKYKVGEYSDLPDIVGGSTAQEKPTKKTIKKK